MVLKRKTGKKDGAKTTLKLKWQETGLIVALFMVVASSVEANDLIELVKIVLG